jgi:hypothetical protein
LGMLNFRVLALGILKLGGLTPGISSFGMLTFGGLIFGILGVGRLTLGMVTLGMLRLGGLIFRILGVGRRTLGKLSFGKLTLGGLSFERSKEGMLRLGTLILGIKVLGCRGTDSEGTWGKLKEGSFTLEPVRNLCLRAASAEGRLLPRPANVHEQVNIQRSGF